MYNFDAPHTTFSTSECFVLNHGLKVATNLFVVKSRVVFRLMKPRQVLADLGVGADVDEHCVPGADDSHAPAIDYQVKDGKMDLILGEPVSQWNSDANQPDKCKKQRPACIASAAQSSV